MQAKSRYRPTTHRSPHGFARTRIDVFDRAVVAGAKSFAFADVEIVVRPALGASVSDVLDAGAYIFGNAGQHRLHVWGP